MLGAGGLRRIADLVGVLQPFVSYLNSVVMPDEDPSSDEDEGGEDEGGEDEGGEDEGGEDEGGEDEEEREED